jgi:phosphoribosylformimino-5-aminoimidazole carboxamide ribotide isomerase
VVLDDCLFKLELGGGIRDEATIQKMLAIGIDRIILGSIAVKDPSFVKEMAAKYPIAVGIDAINGYIAVEGWGEVSSMKATDLAKEFANAGVEAIICTDISKDGTLSGVNVDFTLEIAKASGIQTIASGGVKDEADIIALADTKLIAGVIIGKAFYEGTIDLPKMFTDIEKK